MKEDHSQLHESLRAEYLWIQGAIESYDERSLQIKTWSVTLCSVGVGGAYIEKESPLLIVSAAAALTFWWIEALWKSHQQAYYQRTEEIEAASQAGETIRPFRTSLSWLEAFRQHRDEGRLAKVAMWPHVFLPHLPIALGGAFLYVVHAIWWQL